MKSLSGKTIIITGSSRGIGKAMAVKFARDGANIVVASKTETPHPKLAGTISETAEAVKTAGGNALAVKVDVRFEEQIDDLINAAVDRFGGIDILVNNAGSVNLNSIEGTSAKQLDLMQSINSRAVFLCANASLPHLKKSKNPHILNISPPLSSNRKWVKNHCPYTISKFSMTMWGLGMAEEFKQYGISVNCLWPKTLIATVAVEYIMGSTDIFNVSRKPEIMADAAHEIVTTEGLSFTGQCVTDEEMLANSGMTDFSEYAYAPEYANRLQTDLFL